MRREGRSLGRRLESTAGLRWALAVATAAVALCLVSAGPAYAWGPTAHHIVNTWAIETLPPQIRGFFKANQKYLVEHANDPTLWMKKDRYERMRHYIYLDKYGIFPYLELPHAFRLATQKFGRGHINRDGVLPWQIGEFSLRLTNAMKAGNWEEVKLNAAALAHYVADAHNPLHTTENYDGQLTQQTGLEERFGDRMMNRYYRFLIMHPDDAVKIPDPTEYAFQMCIEANVWVDQIVWSDRRARDGLVDYTDEYYDHFYSQVGATVMREINGASHDAGSYWYTAWLNAGKPALPRQ